tara:strand:+ start:202 stop:420 length:219 start_codon:yes stop_codon:yes gene_type:complete
VSVRVRTNGTKEWVLRYNRPLTAVRTAIKLANYPDLTIINAQVDRTHRLNSLANNIDPLMPTKIQLVANTGA